MMLMLMYILGLLLLPRPAVAVAVAVLSPWLLLLARGAGELALMLGCTLLDAGLHTGAHSQNTHTHTRHNRTVTR